LTFAAAFLKYLAKMHLDVRYRSFELFLERPRRVKVRKNVTNRIVTKEDIESILNYVNRAECHGTISKLRAEQYTAFTVFGAFTGQRSTATMMKLTVGQVREALRASKPVLRVEPSQDKIRMEHYVPLHPQLAGVMGGSVRWQRRRRIDVYLGKLPQVAAEAADSLSKML
jgi:hypothetical protein